MTDSENLRAASLYINNQLLSRGLLRDGQTIDFADPEGSHGGLQDTMGRIISVVNDLILRRDRDAEHRESLSSTLRALRADAIRQTTELSRQSEKLSDTQRHLDISEATERALRAQLKAAEQGIQKLKEDVAKMKSLVSQTRSACANEVRKRDRQIDSLKKAIADSARVRGGGKSRDVITITVTGEYSALGESCGMPAGATQSDGYSLRMETNEFLTELAKGLSEENEGLLSLVQRTVDGLREMSGLDRDAEHSSGHEHGHEHGHHDFVTRPPQKSAEDLAAELEGIIDHLRSILTNPSFAPIEEVEVRDEAIHRLRTGLETMEARWKDAVHMIDGWRKRMVSSGKSVDMEDLQMGLRLSPVRVRDVAETANAIPLRLPCVQEAEEEEEAEQQQQQQQRQQEEAPRQHIQSRDEDQAMQNLRPSHSVESLHLVSAPGYDAEDLGDDSDSDSSILEDDIDINELDVEEPNVQILQISTAESGDSHAVSESAQIKPLKDSYASGNRGPTSQPSQRKRHGDFTTIVEENTWDLVEMEKKESFDAPSRINKPASPKQNSWKKTSALAASENQGSSTSSYDSPLFGKSIERPAQTQSKRNLFSRPSSRDRPTVVTAQTENERSPTGRTTRSTAVKSGPPSPVVIAQPTETSKPTALDSRPSSTEPHKSDEAVQCTTSNGSSSDTKQSGPRSPNRAQPAGSSRLPRPNTQQQYQQQQQSPLNMATIAAKLAASEREADAARVRAKLRAVRRSRRISEKVNENAVPTSPTIKKVNNTESETEATATATATSTVEVPTTATQQEQPVDNMDPVKRDLSNKPAPTTTTSSLSPRRRRSYGALKTEADGDGADELALSPDALAGLGTDKGVVDSPKVRRHRREQKRSNKVASRRRSTLSPWELHNLISGNVAGVGSPAR